MCCKCCDREEKKPEPVAIAPAPPKPEKLHYESLLGLFAVIVMAAIGIALGGVQ